MRHIPISLLFVSAVAAPGCEPPRDNISGCIAGKASETVVEAVTRDVTASVGKAVQLNGTASHPRELAIYSIRIHGLAVKNDGFNFDTWSLSIPAENVATFSAEAKDGIVTLDARVSDACGQSKTLPGLIRLKLP